MPKDFAGRSSISKTRRRKKTTRKASPKQRVLFHGPSFYFGALVGAAIIVLVVYAPELLEQKPAATAVTGTEPAKPKVEFEFAKILKNSEVKSQPEDYAVPPAENMEPASYSIQAASFRVKDDAETLRGRLTLEGLDVKTLSTQVDQSIWYRVVVGPFSKKVEADRAMTRLRELGLSAIWVNRHN